MGTKQYPTERQNLVTRRCVSAALSTIFAVSAMFAQSSVDEIMKRSQAAREKYMEAMAQGIVRVEAYADPANNDPEIGTGIVLTGAPGEIEILTTLHVVKSAKKVNITFYSNRPTRYHATLCDKRSDSLDLAVLQVVAQGNPKLPVNFPRYHFLENNALQLGADIYTVDGDWNLVPNKITHLTRGGDAQRFEYTNASVGVGFSGGPVFDQYGNVLGMHEALSTLKTADGDQYAIAIKIDSALQTLEGLDYTVPKAVPFSMPQLTQAAVGQSTATEARATAKSAVSDLQLYANAIASRDPDAMEAAAQKISNPTFATLLRSQAQTIRETSRGTASAQRQVEESRKRLETENMKIQAKTYSSRGNYMKALPLYQQLAEDGDSESMVRLGNIYHDGRGTQKNYQEALKWYRKAANLGEPQAMSSLGYMYTFGEGLATDDKLALQWDRKAADLGDPAGMVGLGFLYQNGRAVSPDRDKALSLYRKAAALGNETAKQILQKMGLTQ